MALALKIIELITSKLIFCGHEKKGKKYPNPAYFRKFGTPPENVNLVRLLFFFYDHCSPERANIGVN